METGWLLSPPPCNFFPPGGGAAGGRAHGRPRPCSGSVVTRARRPRRPALFKAAAPGARPAARPLAPRAPPLAPPSREDGGDLWLAAWRWARPRKPLAPQLEIREELVGLRVSQANREPRSLFFLNAGERRCG